MKQTAGKRAAVVLAGAVVAILVTAFAAWACISVATFQASISQAKPGDAVTVSGLEFHSNSPAVIRWNAVDGPVLAEFKVESGRFSGPVTIPADAKPGYYVLVATQEANPASTTWGIPARALVKVVGEGGAAVVGPPLGVSQVERPVGLVTDKSVGIGDLALAGLGAAGLAMFIAGMAALAAGRRTKPVAEPVAAKK